MSSLSSSLRSLDTPLNREVHVAIREPEIPERKPLETVINRKTIAHITAAILAIGAQLAASYLIECDSTWTKRVQLVQSISLLSLAALALCHSQTAAERTQVQVYVEDPFVSYAPDKKVTRKFRVDDMELPFAKPPEYSSLIKVYTAISITTLFSSAAPVLQLTLLKTSHCANDGPSFVLPSFVILSACVSAIFKGWHEREVSNNRAIELARLRDVMKEADSWSIGPHVKGSLNELWDRIRRMPQPTLDATYLSLIRLFTNAQISRFLTMPYQTNVRKSIEEKS